MGKRNRCEEMKIADARLGEPRRVTWYTVRGGNARPRYWSRHSDAQAYARRVGGDVYPEQVLLVPGLAGKAWPLGLTVSDETYYAPIEVRTP